jgi:N-acetylglucosaminyldiphosphoundecaprenol N-acetyl-beta-D-mannosaminyltransferase
MTTAVPRSRDRSRPRQPLFGLEIDALSMEEVLVRARRAMADRTRLLVGVVNAAKIVHMRTDDLLRNSLLEADLLLADGQSVVWASRLLHRPLPERVTGIDLFQRLLELADGNGRSVYFLGARTDVLEQMLNGVTRRFPGLRIAGARNGYFGAAESAAVARGIAGSGADMLFLGMPSPTKEIFLARFADGLDVPILHGVGGSFDVMAGVTPRAPRLWQRLGAEWAFRLLQEPRRLWRRYWSTNTAFIALTIGEFIQATPTYSVPAPTRTGGAIGPSAEPRGEVFDKGDISDG